MMINSKWQTERQLDIEQYRLSGKHIDVLSSFNQATRWLVVVLTNANIPFKIINVGAGVKRITTRVNICPKCNGTGTC